MVVLCHCASGYFLAGSAGVDIFFVISGFIITRVLGGRSASDFAIDRLTRVYPIYWLALLPLLPWGGLASARLATSITLWPWFGAIDTPCLVPAWTLSFELLFYAGACLVLWRRWMGGVLAAAFLLCFTFSSRHPVLGYLGNPLIFEFLFGVALARMPHTQHRVAGSIVLLLGLAAILILADLRFGMTSLIFVPNDRALMWGVPAALIVWGGLQWESRMQGSWWLLLVLGGEASYALYLSHPTVLLLAPHNPYLKLALMPFVCVALSWPVHRLLERPLTRQVRNLVSRMRTSGPTPS